MNTSPVVENSAAKDLEDALRPKIENPSARMHFRGVGDLLFPGSCCVCNNGTCEQGYVDIGVYFDYEGQVYLCMLCLTEAAETGGLLSIEQSEFLKDLCTKAIEENNELRLIMKEMSDRLERYESAITAGHITFGSPDSSTSGTGLLDLDVSEGEQGVSSSPDGDSNDSTDERSSGEAKPDEPAKSKDSKRTKRVTSTNTSGIEI